MQDFVASPPRLARHLSLAPLPRPLSDYAGVYENPLLGRMEWRVVAEGLEMRLGVIRSRAEVYDAERSQLRFEIGGSGAVASFEFVSDDASARSVTIAGQRFERVSDGP